jgi:molybdenum cofactor biosynthesis protein B
MPKIDKSIPFQPVRIAVLTVSDTRTQRTDKSGTLLGQMLTESGHQLAEHAIAKDDIDDTFA